jgi:hypothetical protein
MFDVLINSMAIEKNLIVLKNILNLFICNFLLFPQMPKDLPQE